MSFSEELNGLMDCPTPLVRRFMALLEPVDDARLEAAVALLQELAQQRQVLLFTCHNREQQLLTALGSPEREAGRPNVPD